MKPRPFTTALLSHLRHHPPHLPLSDAHQRLLMVLRDQLNSAPVKDNFLPFTGDPVIRPILEKLERDPASNTPLAILAREAGITMRTLHRRCEATLGMSLNQWRQRLRVVRAMPLLEKGEKIESVAFEMGYSTASAFIAMFSRQTGRTPGGNT
ncbi:helix-turn-helix domain-containing protein [Shimwellia pseudoproteus]|uniref:helix-turn-helix domain-containing protein n=1 Tax=Shimwellia pseudoproteus TaxID=570012 RepID=UPI0018EC42FA|nr:AraC family transcriptional regulator [Shimwellia pseudoproteus]